MGGGGGSYRNWRTESLSGAIKKESDKAAEEFELELSGFLSGLLGSYNSRDAELVHDRLDQAKAAIEDELETSIDTLFGGSVAKRTYVDGLSDIDSLLVLKSDEHGPKNPHELLDHMESALRDHLSSDIKVSGGEMAVTLTYPDGMSIQLLPAVRTETGLRVPATGRDTWSEIDPQRFQELLTERNQECGGKLVPTIKLAKAAVASFPGQYHPTGYHMESLAIKAFKGYEGTKTTSAMLPYFFERAKDLVLTPISDETGQSTHVDDYLGGENSELRRDVGHLFARTAKRMRNASAAKSAAQWESLFSSED